jgi:hypothetical protein
VRRRRTTHRDPTADRARISNIVELLTELPEERVIVLLATTVYGLTEAETAQHFGIPLERVKGIQWQTVSRLRHPSRPGTMDLITELEGVVPTSAEFRVMLRQLGLAELDAPSLCAHCRRPAVLPRLSRSSGGRPRKFCSDACRQAAYRVRGKQRGGRPPSVAAH